MKKAVIFDMDGVLIDSEVLWADKEFKLFSKQLAGWTRDRQRELAGRSIEGIYELMRSWYPDLPYDREGFIGLYKDFAAHIYAVETKMNPGAEELITGLHEKGVRTALATSTSRKQLEIVVERFGLERLFELMITATEVDGRGKPAPDIYLHTLEKLELQPSQAVAVEDTSNGIKAAKAAGLYCIGYVSDPVYDRSEADIVVEEFSELTSEWIKGL